MKQFRSVLLTFSFIFFGIGSSVLNFLIMPVAKAVLDEGDFSDFSSWIINKLWIFFVKYMEFVRLFKINLKNPEKLKEIKNKIVVVTHPSFADILILMSLIPKSTCFVKSTLTKNFVLKNIVNSIFIPNDVDIEILKSETKKYLDKGFNVIIFPMGTRHRKNEYPKIKKGASLIALNSNKDIVPIKMHSSEDFLFINQPFYSAGEHNVEFSIEVLDTININDLKEESEIITKRNITEAISAALYC